MTFCEWWVLIFYPLFFRRLTAGRPTTDNSAFTHDYFDEFSWTDLAYKRSQHIPYVPKPETPEEVQRLVDNGIEVGEKQTYTGDAVFKF